MKNKYNGRRLDFVNRIEDDLYFQNRLLKVFSFLCLVMVLLLIGIIIQNHNYNKCANELNTIKEKMVQYENSNTNRTENEEE